MGYGVSGQLQFRQCGQHEAVGSVGGASVVFGKPHAPVASARTRSDDSDRRREDMRHLASSKRWTFGLVYQIAPLVQPILVLLSLPRID